jgi:hypothetical protein
MVQVAGTTYRIVERRTFHEVVRVLDDRVVGVFRHQPAMTVIESTIPGGVLLDIARQARLTARLAWAPPRSNAHAGLVQWVERLLFGLNRAAARG